MSTIRTAHLAAIWARAVDLKQLWKNSPEPVEQVVNVAAEGGGLFEIQQLLIGGQQDVFVSLPQDSLCSSAERSRMKVNSVWMCDLSARYTVDHHPLGVPCRRALVLGHLDSIGAASEEQVKQKVIAEVIDELKKRKSWLSCAGGPQQTSGRGNRCITDPAEVGSRAGNALRARQILLRSERPVLSPRQERQHPGSTRVRMVLPVEATKQRTLAPRRASERRDGGGRLA